MRNSSSVRRVTLDQAKIIKAKKDKNPQRFFKNKLLSDAHIHCAVTRSILLPLLLLVVSF